jgi:hypothetical protein
MVEGESLLHQQDIEAVILDEQDMSLVRFASRFRLGV